MKKILLLLSALTLSVMTFADGLILIENLAPTEIKNLFRSGNLAIHHYTDNMVIATERQPYSGSHVEIDAMPWHDDTEYYIVRYEASSRTRYLHDISSVAEVLYETTEFAVIAVDPDESPLLYPAIHGGLVRIPRETAKLPSPGKRVLQSSIVPSADIYQMMSEVDTVNLENYVQHLQDYGTRNAYSTQAVQAQNWIYDQFVSFGLDVELHDFSMPGGSASDNIIATLTGTTYPDEYIVCGGHYDSYSFSGSAPGADDNATGTAGIMEAARIMSQYTFDRTIIFAAWGGEEYGLYGSEAWASEAAADGMNILGYFNMDMAGYRHPGDEIHTDIIAPSTAQELVDFYIDVCAIYLPDFGVYEGFLSGGDSDHTSFNNNGYQGIFPFEDDNNHSPYIHTSDDIIGLSVNSFEMHSYFTKAIIANVATMSDQLPSPQIVSAIAGDEVVDLTWSSLDSVTMYNIYRNGDPTPFTTSVDTVFQDTAVMNMTPYTYYVTAIFSGTGEESGPSNQVTVVPMPPISIPFIEDFETGGYYWTMEDSWGLKEGIFLSASNSMTESPDGNYLNSMNSSSTLRSIDLTNAINAELSFWSRYQIEEDWDFMYLEVSTNGSDWEMLDIFTGTRLSWTQDTYPLDDYLGEETFFIRFRFESDDYVTAGGMHIDDLIVYADGVGLNEITGHSIRLSQNNPNPCSATTTISFYLEESSPVTLNIFDTRGRLIQRVLDRSFDRGTHTITIETEELEAGHYYYSITDGASTVTKKMVKIN